MQIDRHPTHLKGELGKLEWYLLTPHELLRAVGASSTKAAAALELADHQIEAANWLSDSTSAQEYETTRWLLAQIAKPAIA